MFMVLKHGKKTCLRGVKKMTKKIHINQHMIKANRKDGRNRPVISCKTYKSNVYGHSVKLTGPATVIYSPEKPLSCGAHCWVETEYPVIVKDEAKELADYVE